MNRVHALPILERPSTQPFPAVLGRYEVLPGMRLFGKAGFGMPPEWGHFRLDRTTPFFLEEKLRVLAGHGAEARQVDPLGDPPLMVEALWRTLACLAEEEPTWAVVDDDVAAFPMLGFRLRRCGHELDLESTVQDAVLGELGQRIVAQIEGQTGLARWLDACALVVPCDFSLVVAGTEEEPEADRTELLHVCFPSSWAPRLKVGRDFAEIHRPVANNEVLLKGHVNLVRAMCYKGPFVRYAWGFHRHAGLDSHPDFRPPKADLSHLGPDALAAQTWFRVERQTTRPFAGLNRGLFTIRTFIEPLSAVVADPAKARQLASAIRSMDAQSQRYKGIPDRREALLAYLDAASKPS